MTISDLARGGGTVETVPSLDLLGFQQAEEFAAAWGRRAPRRETR